MQLRRSFAAAALAATVLGSAMSASALAGASAGASSAAPNVAAAAPRATLATAHVRLVAEESGLSDPVAIAWRAGDPRMYVAEQSGHVRVVSNGRVVGTALTLHVAHGNEQGLLGLAFSLDGKRMYIDYTDVDGNTRVVALTMHGGHAVSPRRLLYLHQPFANHNGGEVAVGPGGMLYIGFGDGGGGGDPHGNAQNLNTWLGKILRIDPRLRDGLPYHIPPDNPFNGVPGARREIWMYGLRNPWRFSVDRRLHDMWIGDVGQAAYEEIDYARAHLAGLNWGWNLREGFHPYNGGAQPANGRDPILERAHTLGDCAIVGGYVYRGALMPALRGAYLFGDFCTGELRAIVQTNGTVTQSRDLALDVPQLTSFAEGPHGELRALSRSGTIYVLAPA
jgi:glucose/arabinose dehydrogenase